MDTTLLFPIAVIIVTFGLIWLVQMWLNPWRGKVAPIVVPADSSQPPSSRGAIVALALANVVPLVGVLFLGWSVFDVLATFWLESVAIGCINLLKIIRVGGLRGVPGAIFFAIHFGMFSAVHLLFIVALFRNGMMWSPLPAGAEPPVPFSPFAAAALVFGTYWAAGLSYLLSHGYSFLANFLGRQEWRRLTVHSTMVLPYGRVVAMHFTILLGGFLAAVLRQPAWAVVLLVVLKVALDVRAHVRERKPRELLPDLPMPQPPVTSSRRRSLSPRSQLAVVLVMAAAVAATIALDRAEPIAPPSRGSRQLEYRDVLVYQYVAALDEDEAGNVLCSSAGLVPLRRSVVRTENAPADAVRELLAGQLTDAERARGLTTEFPLPGVTLVSADLESGLLTLAIEDRYSRTSGGSCRASILRAQVEATARQFREVQQVVILPEDLFQP